ncbi:retrovirus-related pol polyprotein from transposon TNT 1-94, partial [Tanacetum coccineum]
MTGNLKLLCNFVEKYLGTVRFGNDQFALILGYGDLVQGNITINRVYYIEGLNHNLFSVGQFCDADLEVAFRKSTCFIRDLRETIYSLKDVVIGLPKLKYVKDQLCSSCEVSKAKRSSFKTKAVLSSKGRLNLLHMDLCGPMRVASINRKKYILVIIDDYSRYTWTLFLRSKDETPEVLKDFLIMIQQNVQALVISVRTDRGTYFLNKTLHAFFKEEGIEHQTSTPRSHEQNGVVERRNCTLVEAARTMLSAFKLPLTKMPMVVPISTRKPKQTVNQSAATPLKRTVATESTNQKPRSTIRKQYKQISKTCKWWYCKITPPGYKWKPKSVNVEPNVSMHLGTKSRTTNILEPTTLRKSTVSNTPSSSNSFVARRDFLFIVDSGCSKHMTGNLKLLSNFVEQFP